LLGSVNILLQQELDALNGADSDLDKDAGAPTPDDSPQAPTT
jgi:hypothetical protein